MPPDYRAAISYYEKQIARLDARAEVLILQYQRDEARILSLVFAALIADRVKSLRDRRKQTALAKQILRALDETTQVEIPNLMNSAAQLGTRMAELGSGEDLKGLSQVNRRTITLLTENLIKDLGTATQTVGRLVDDVFRHETLRTAIENVPGERPETLQSARLRKSLEDTGLTAFRDKLGRSWSLERYSKMAVKTVTQEAVNVSQENLLRERQFDIVEISKSNDPCKKKCIHFDGKKFSLTGRARKFPTLKERAPFHPECRHYMFLAPEGVHERNEFLQRELVAA